MYVFRIAVGPLVALVLAACPVLAPAAHADGASATGRSGQTLTVSRVDGLPTTGATLRVTGRGYDTGKGIYVALCADNGPGRLPSPCGGGADTSGKTGASQWISSNPPPYGKGLAVPYGPGGTFDVTIRVGAKLSASQDCTKIRCAVVTRADHIRTSDRSQDVRVPVTFDTGGGVPAWGWAAIGAGVVVVLAAGALVLRRRGAAARRTP